MHGTIGNITIDCSSVQRLMDFWALALSYQPERSGSCDTLVDPAGAGPSIYFQEVPEAKTVKDRAHIDVSASDAAALISRLEAAGGRVVGPGSAIFFGSTVTWTVLTDPEGNEFCVTEYGGGANGSIASVTTDCADPHRLAAFWAAVVGYTPPPPRSPERTEPARLAVAIPPQPGLPMMFFPRVPEGKVGKNRVHVDVRVSDRAEAVAAFAALGATMQQAFDNEGHTVMLDPEGNEFCVYEG